MASLKLLNCQCSGRIPGGIAMLSSTVLKLVRNIHTNGKIMIMLPTTKNA